MGNVVMVKNKAFINMWSVDTQMYAPTKSSSFLKDQKVYL